MNRTQQWARARSGFLYGAAWAGSVGGIIAISGAIRGQVFVVTAALGGIGLSLAAALVALDTLYPGLTLRERRVLMIALLVSVVAYFSLLSVGAAGDNQTTLTLAGLSPMATGSAAVWLALHRRQSRRDSDDDL